LGQGQRRYLRGDWKALTAGSGYNTLHTFDMTKNRATTSGYVYDGGSANGSGNLTSNGPGTSYSYDQENFMLTVGSNTYKYDAQGRRVRKTISGTVTEYFYSGSVVVSEKQGSTWTDYVFFGSQRIAKQTGSTATTATYIHADHLGSTRVCTDGSGNANGTCDGVYPERSRREPFGEFVGGSCPTLPDELPLCRCRV
jgi:hypothetical protein